VGVGGGGCELYAGPYDPPLIAPPGTSAEAAIATAAYQTLVGLYVRLPNGVVVGLDPAQRHFLDDDYAAYMAAIPEGQAKSDGIALGGRVDRGGRELPIQPDIVGKQVKLNAAERVDVLVEEIDGKDEVDLVSTK